MYYKLTSLRWWLAGVNPFRTLGVWQTLVWLLPVICFVLVYFPVWEFIGVKRKYGAVPFTWVIECQPPFLIAIEFAIAIWHFILHNWPLGRGR